jgi:hypothetical protein
VTDLPFQLEPALAGRLATHLDAEGKLLRALDALGPLTGRDVAVVGGGPRRVAELERLGSRVRAVSTAVSTGLDAGSVDAIVSWWSAFNGSNPGELAEANRVLRPGGRVLAVHDYGRDDVSRLHDQALPQYGAWSRRDGPFLADGWKIRVVHCWWTFGTVEEAADFLGSAFGEAGTTLAATLRRPRLSYNVAVYHRTRGPEPR